MSIQSELIIYLLIRAAAMTLRTVLLSLQALLASPEPDDPVIYSAFEQCKYTISL